MRDDCPCYLAHGVEHLCERHRGMPYRSDLWVESGFCWECICDELERNEARVAELQHRLRFAKHPREWVPEES